jgi:hypothetical protein
MLLQHALAARVEKDAERNGVASSLRSPADNTRTLSRTGQIENQPTPEWTDIAAMST